MDWMILQSSVTLFEILCVIIVFASIFMTSRFFNEVYEYRTSWSTRILLIVFFGILSIFGTLSGLSIDGAVINIRDLGPMAAGLVCGPYIGIGSGIIGGLFRFAQGGPYMWTGLSAPILSGILGSIMYLANKRQFVPTWVAVLLIGLSETLISCYTLVLVTKPSEFFAVVTMVAIPMVIFNIIGMYIFASVVHRILDERKAQKEMQALELEVESRRNLSTIINTIAYPVYVLDRNHRLILVNDSFCRFTNRLREDLSGKTHRDLYTLHDAENHWEMVETAFRTHASREEEVTITKPVGQSCTIISTSSMFWDAGGQEFMVGVIQDITERKKMAKALAESEAWYRILFEHTGAATIIINENGTISQVNSGFEQITGYSRAEIEGKMSLAQIAHPDDLERVKKYHHERRNNPASAPTSYTVRIHNRSGAIKTLHAVVALISGTRKSIASYVDISEQKKSEESLMQANRKLNLLSGITRHDINNQVTVILGYIQMLQQKQPEPALNMYYQTLETAAKRISAMIRFTKDYEKIGVKAPEWHNCRTLADTATKQTSLGKVIVKNDLPAGAEVFTDTLIVKVFFNLMDNAVRHGGKITTIRYTLEKSGDNYMIVCEDDGEGITAEEKERIFERGFGKNTGLGLALSREILSITGITIHETGESGKGARFEMTIPKGLLRFYGH